MSGGKVLEIEYYAVSDIGRTRANHEDIFYLPTGDFVKENEVNKENRQVFYKGKLTDKSADFKCFAVADGMGGHNAGEVASGIIADMLNKHAGGCRTVADFEKLADRINMTVFEAGQSDKARLNLGSTLAAAIISGNKIYSVNVGDSRVYLYGAPGLKRLSHDHTEGQLLIDIGVIKSEKDDLYKARSSLTRFIGMNTSETAGLSYVSDGYGIESFSLCMLCSDGLTSFVGDDKIEEILSVYLNAPLDEIGVRLLKEAFDTSLNDRAGSDNITLILLKPVFAEDNSGGRRGFLSRLFKKDK